MFDKARDSVGKWGALIAFPAVAGGIAMTPALASEHRVGPAGVSTSFGYYAVSPESPNGEQITYIRYVQPPKTGTLSRPAELWICNRNAKNHRKVADLGPCPTHNGARAMWVANDRIAVHTGNPGPTGGELRVCDISSGKPVFEPFHATLTGPTQFEGHLIFWVWPEQTDLCGRPAGAYQFNTVTGSVSLLFDMNDLKALTDNIPGKLSRGARLLPIARQRLYHVKFSPDGSRIAFRADVLEKPGGGKVKALAFYHRETKTFSWFPDLRPNHYFWYDNESIAGHDINPARLPFRRLRRFDLAGKPLEDLGAKGIHVAPSPDRQAFASDSMWSERRGVHTYRRGQFVPRFLSDSTPFFDRVTRGLRFHQNPSFSRDGSRVYYHKPLSPALNGTFYSDLSEEGDGGFEPDPITVKLVNDKIAFTPRETAYRAARNFPDDLRPGNLLYYAPLDGRASIEGWRMEGPGEIAFRDGWMRMRAPGEAGHHVFWCPERFPESFIAQWEAQNLETDAGLCIVFFAAAGLDGQSVFADSLPKRNGTFKQYIKGSIGCYHISYYANTPKVPDRQQTNMRKNPGFHLVHEGPEGIPTTSRSIHSITLAREGARIRLWIDDRKVVDWTDDGKTGGKPHGGGFLGLRQMKWTHFRYRDFNVWSVADSTR